MVVGPVVPSLLLGGEPEDSTMGGVCGRVGGGVGGVEGREVVFK